MMRPGSQAGSSLIELIVGGAIALLALGVIIQMQISGYRYQQRDEDRFVVQMKSASALDHLSRDLRMASSAQFVQGGNSISLMVGGNAVVYSHNAASGQVVRSEDGLQQVIGQRVERIAFYTEGNGPTIRVEWMARLPDGTTYLLESRVSPRVHAGG